MSKDNPNKVVKFDHNYKNRSPIQELVEQNAKLDDNNNRFFLSTIGTENG